jgi:hypothetical protein
MTLGRQHTCSMTPDRCETTNQAACQPSRFSGVSATARWRFCLPRLHDDAVAQLVKQRNAPLRESEGGAEFAVIASGAVRDGDSQARRSPVLRSRMAWLPIKRAHMSATASASPRRRLYAERRKRLHGHDPWRQRACKTFGEKRTERLIFPRLDVAGGPVVEQAEAEQM